MSKIRPDDNITVVFERRGGIWGDFHITFEEVTDDGAYDPVTQTPTKTYHIEDLPAQIKTVLAEAWAGMKAHRDSMTPIT
jgi:hypothetical protein